MSSSQKMYKTSFLATRLPSSFLKKPEMDIGIVHKAFDMATLSSTYALATKPAGWLGPPLSLSSRKKKARAKQFRKCCYENFRDLSRHSPGTKVFFKVSRRKKSKIYALPVRTEESILLTEGLTAPLSIYFPYRNRLN